MGPSAAAPLRQVSIRTHERRGGLRALHQHPARCHPERREESPYAPSGRQPGARRKSASGTALRPLPEHNDRCVRARHASVSIATSESHSPTAMSTPAEILHAVQDDSVRELTPGSTAGSRAVGAEGRRRGMVRFPIRSHSIATGPDPIVRAKGTTAKHSTGLPHAVILNGVKDPGTHHRDGSRLRASGDAAVRSRLRRRKQRPWLCGQAPFRHGRDFRIAPTYRGDDTCRDHPRCSG